MYYGVAVNSEGLIAVTDCGNKRVHIFNKEGTLGRSIGEGVLGGDLLVCILPPWLTTAAEGAQ